MMVGGGDEDERLLVSKPKKETVDTLCMFTEITSKLNKPFRKGMACMFTANVC